MLLEGNAGFPGDVAHSLRTAKPGAHLSCAALVPSRVRDRRGSAGRWCQALVWWRERRGCSRPIWRLNESPSIKPSMRMAPKKWPMPLPTLRLEFLAKGERRCKRPPIRAAERTAEDVHHNGETVAFVSARSRSEPRAGARLRRPCHSVGCGAALAVDGPALGNRLAAPARNFDFSVRGGASGHVNHDGGSSLPGKAMAMGLVRACAPRPTMA